MDSSGETAPEAIEWTSHPARARPVAATVTTLFLVLLVAVVHYGFHDPLMTVFAVAVLALSLAPFYLPTSYAITEDTVTVRTPFSRKEKRLTLFRRLMFDRHGALLSPFDRPSRLDRFHGLNLRFDARDRDRVVRFLERRFARNDRQA
jgi:hypothetical protein